MTNEVGYTSLFEEILVDNFAGGGGASTGMELATGKPVTIAVNHDPDAIRMHETNHPYTEHYCESVWKIDPAKVCRGRPVGLAWFSPDCKHFSKARGGKPADKNIRGLAWIVLRWAGTVRPRVIILENVEEFPTWGPVRKGKPVKSKSGETFLKWKSQLSALGYEIEHKELIAADFGAPTIRKRFFLIARCDGQPIVWPEATHAPVDSVAVRNGEKKPWVSAAEIIDWSLPCPSVFASKSEIKEQYGLSAVRPLADNTMRRVIRGVNKFVIKSGKPFIVQVNHSGGDRCCSTQVPLPTLTAKHGYGVTSPVLAPLTMHNNENAAGTSITDPVNTITTCGQQMLLTASLMAIGQTGGGDRNRAITAPIHTTVSKAEECIVAPSLIQYHSEQTEHVRGQSINQPMMTVDSTNRYGLSAATLVKYYGNDQHGQDINAPAHTVTSKDREGLALAHLSKFYGGAIGADVTEPVPTITQIDHNALGAAFISKFYKSGIGQSCEEPLHTVTTSPGHLGEVITTIVKATHGTPLHHWPEIRELLIKHCGYRLADDEVILLWISGVAYFIADIGLRMLSPRELYLANGFPPDYIIDYDYTGKVYSKTKQVARCGNAVPPPFAEALVRANLPEMCGVTINSMLELERSMAL